jgi:Coenzyme PQQ synthesis protein D (PqqD)
MIELTNRVFMPSHVMVRFLDDESVFLNLETERYFGLDQTGTRMWQVLTDSESIEAAYRQLLDEFAVEPEVLRTDLLGLLSKLVDHDLLQLGGSDVGPTSTI